MRVYIAGGTPERLTIVQPYIVRARAAGITITHDWTECEGYNKSPTDQEKAGYALNDSLGVITCDALWGIVPEERSEGHATELGIALATHKYVILSGTRAGNSVFHHLANEVHATHEAAFDRLLIVSNHFRERYVKMTNALGMRSI